MKKHIAFLLCLIVILSMFSCELNENQDDLLLNENTDSSDMVENDGTNGIPEAERAMEMYESAIKGEVCVFDEHQGDIKLEDCRFPSNNLRLGECEILNKAILDMDGDGINEYVIQSEAKDHIVLHYCNGKVYAFCFDSSNFYNLNTDGSFYWIDSYESESCIRGLNQIIFNESSFRIKEIYSIIQIGAYDYGDKDNEYYVGGKQITREEFIDYYAANHRNKRGVIFSSLDISCEYPISSEKAYELASNYWGFKNGMSEGATGTVIVNRIVILEKPNSDTLSYHICWQMEGYSNHIIDGWYSQQPHNVRTHKELFVDAITGECREHMETDSTVSVSRLNDSILDICTGEAENRIHQYYDIKNKRLSEEYSLVAAAGFDHIAYLKGNGFDMVLVIRHIFDKELYYEEKQENFNIRYNDPVLWAEFTENADALNITYYDYSGDIITITVPVRASAEENPIFQLFYWSIGNGTCRVGERENIESVSIPSTSPYGEKVVKIGSFCFYQNKSLKAVVIPNTVSEIGNYAFEGCTNLETVIFRGTEKQWEKVTGRENIPSSVNIVFEE